MNPVLLTCNRLPSIIAAPPGGRAMCRLVKALARVGNQVHALGTETRAGVVRGIKVLFPPARRVVFESARFRDPDPHLLPRPQDPRRRCDSGDAGCGTAAPHRADTDDKDHLSALPVEIHQVIGRHLGHVDLVRMGATCHRLRQRTAGQAFVARIKAGSGVMNSAKQFSLIVRLLDRVESLKDLHVCGQQVLDALRYLPTAELSALDRNVRDRIRELLSVFGDLFWTGARKMIEAAADSGCGSDLLRQRVQGLAGLPADEQERMMGWLPSTALHVGKDSVHSVVRELVTTPPLHRGTLQPGTFIALARLVQWLPAQEWGEMFDRLAEHAADRRIFREWPVSGFALLVTGLQPEKHRDAFVFLSSLLRCMPEQNADADTDASMMPRATLFSQRHAESVSDSLLVLRIATFDQAGACHRLLDRLAAAAGPGQRGHARQQMHDLARGRCNSDDYRRIIHAMNDDLNAGRGDEDIQRAIHALVASYVGRLASDDRTSFVRALLEAGLQMRFMDATAFSNLRTVLDTMPSNEQRVIIYLLARTPSDDIRVAEAQDHLLRGLLESRQGEWHRARKAILKIQAHRRASRHMERPPALMP